MDASCPPPTSILPPMQCGHSGTGHLRGLALDIDTALRRGGIHVDVEYCTKLGHLREDIVADVFLPTCSTLTGCKEVQQHMTIPP